jgi:hypothetical protein
MDDNRMEDIEDPEAAEGAEGAEGGENPEGAEGGESPETVDYEDGNATGMFGNLKRAAGIDTNKFRASASYMTLHGEKKTVEIAQLDSFAKMMSQPFFADLLNDGPLHIYTLTIASEKPDSSYHVHDKLIKSIDDLIRQYGERKFIMSMVDQLTITLKIDSKEAGKFNNALIKIATLFNIKYVDCTYNGKKSNDLEMRSLTYTGPQMDLEAAPAKDAGLLKTAYKAAQEYAKTDSSLSFTERVNAAARTPAGQALIAKGQKMYNADADKQTSHSVGFDEEPEEIPPPEPMPEESAYYNDDYYRNQPAASSCTLL